MTVTLHERTADTVRIYFERAQQPWLRRTLPQKAKTLEEALDDFERTQLPGANSFGRTICFEGRYVGDVWIYCIDPAETPNAMLSYCVFEPEAWGRGVASEAVRLFLQEVEERFKLQSLGAFTYAENIASVRVLEKNGFRLEESFTEDGVQSCYYQKNQSVSQQIP